MSGNPVRDIWNHHDCNQAQRQQTQTQINQYSTGYDCHKDYRPSPVLTVPPAPISFPIRLPRQCVFMID